MTRTRTTRFYGHSQAHRPRHRIFDTSDSDDDSSVSGPCPCPPPRNLPGLDDTAMTWLANNSREQPCAFSQRSASSQREFQHQWRNFVRSASLPRLASSNSVAPLGGLQVEGGQRPGGQQAQAFAGLAPPRRRNRNSHTAMARNCCLSTWAVFLGAYHLFAGFLMTGECAKTLVNLSNGSCAPLHAPNDQSYDEISDNIVRPTALKMSLYLNNGLLGVFLICGTLKRSRTCLLVWIIWFCTMEAYGFEESWEFEPVNLPTCLWRCFKDLCQVSLVSLARNEIARTRTGVVPAGAAYHIHPGLLDTEDPVPLVPGLGADADADHVDVNLFPSQSQRAPDSRDFNTRTHVAIFNTQTTSGSAPTVHAESQTQPQPVAPTESTITANNDNDSSSMYWWPPGLYD